MPTLNIEGQSVNVDDSFLKLSPDEQNSTVDEIAKSLKPAAQQQDMGNVNFGDVGMAALRGIPIAGGLIERNSSPESQARYKQFDTQHPMMSNLAQTAGGAASLMAPTALPGRAGQLAAKALGLTGDTLKAQVANSALSGGAIAGADALARGNDPIRGAEIGAGTGAAAPLIGRAVGSVFARSGAPAVKAAQGAVHGAATNAYDAITNRTVATPIAQSELDNVANSIKTQLNREAIRPSTADKIHAAVEEIKSPATAGAPDVADLVAARENIKSLLGSPDRNKAGAAVAIPRIDAAIERLSPGTMASLREADKNYAAFKATQALDKRLARAELSAAGAHSGLNTGNQIRQNVRNYLISNESKYLSDANRKSLEKVVKGTVAQNTLRGASNLLGGGGGLGSTLLGLTGAGVGSYEGHPEFAALPLAGLGLRVGANRMVARQAQKAAAEMLSRSPFGVQTGLQNSLKSIGSPNSPLAAAIYRAIAQRSLQPQLLAPQ